MSPGQQKSFTNAGSSAPPAPPAPPPRKPSSIGMHCYDSVRPCPRDNDLFLTIRHHSMPFAKPSNQYAQEEAPVSRFSALEQQVEKKFLQGEYRWASNSMSFLQGLIKGLYLAVMVPLFFCCYELPRSLFCELLPQLLSYSQRFGAKIGGFLQRGAQKLALMYRDAIKLLRKLRQLFHFSLDKPKATPTLTSETSKKLMFSSWKKSFKEIKSYWQQLAQQMNAFGVRIRLFLRNSALALETKLRTILMPLEKYIEHMLWRVFVAPLQSLFEAIKRKCLHAYKKLFISPCVWLHDNCVAFPWKKACELEAQLRVKWYAGVQKMSRMTEAAKSYGHKMQQRPLQAFKTLELPSIPLPKNLSWPFQMPFQQIGHQCASMLKSIEQKVSGAVVGIREFAENSTLKKWSASKFEDWQRQLKMFKDKLKAPRASTAKQITTAVDSEKPKKHQFPFVEAWSANVKPVVSNGQRRAAQLGNQLSALSTRLGEKCGYTLLVTWAKIKVLSRHGLALARAKTPRLIRSTKQPSDQRPDV